MPGGGARAADEQARGGDGELSHERGAWALGFDAVGRIPRHLGGIAAGIAALLVVPSSAFAGKAFIDGVTAGEVTTSSAIIWAQTKKQHAGRQAITADIEPVRGSNVGEGVLGLNST